MRRRLLVLQDSPDFGGHETMFLRLLPALIDGDGRFGGDGRIGSDGRPGGDAGGTHGRAGFDRIAIRYAAGNAGFGARLAEFDPAIVDARPWPFAKRRAEPYLAGFRRSYAAAVRALVAAEAPDALLLLQGRIENLAVPMLAAPAGLPVISYIPMAHDMRTLGRASLPGDLVRRRLYARPDRFIVPSHSVARQVRAAGARSDAIVVENVAATVASPTRRQARDALGLPHDRKIALLLGRLEARQKGIDLLAAAIRRGAADLHDWQFLFVGDGPDAGLVKALAAELGDTLAIAAVGWTDLPQRYLAAADLLLMPSRWEGVPLVMLDAMRLGVPVLGSQIDVFREYLPEPCRCDFAGDDLPASLARAHSPEARDRFRAAAADRVAADGLARSRAAFAAALGA